MSIILNPLESGHRQYAESLTSTPLACPVLIGFSIIIPSFQISGKIQEPFLLLSQLSIPFTHCFLEKLLITKHSLGL